MLGPSYWQWRRPLTRACQPVNLLSGWIWFHPKQKPPYTFESNRSLALLFSVWDSAYAIGSFSWSWATMHHFRNNLKLLEEQYSPNRIWSPCVTGIRLLQAFPIYGKRGGKRIIAPYSLPRACCDSASSVAHWPASSAPWLFRFLYVCITMFRCPQWLECPGLQQATLRILTLGRLYSYI